MCLLRKKKNTHSTNFWIQLLLFSIVLHGTASESETAGFRRAPADDTVDSLQRFSRSTSEIILHGNASESEIPRDRRAPADEIIENLQRLSRITSGIALESGLLDGSLTPDAAVRDLLHLGSLAPSQLVSMDSSFVKSAMDEFKTLIAGINNSPQVTTIEDRLLILEKIRTSFDVAQFKDLTGVATYRKLLDEVVKLDSEKAKIDPIKKAAYSTFSGLQTFIDSDNGLDEAAAKGEKGRMLSITTDIGRFEKAAPSFDPMRQLLKATKTLNAKSSFLPLLVKEFDFRSIVKSKIKFDGVPDLIKNVNNVYSHQKSKSTFKESLEVLLKLIHSRDDTSVHPFSFASGLPHGSKDLELLATDSTDDWIQKKAGEATGRLKIAFDSLNGVMDHLKSVEDGWKSIHSKSNPAVSILGLQTTVLSLADKSDSVSKAIDGFKLASEKRDGSDRMISEIQVPRDLIEQLNAKTENINTFEYVEKLKDLSFLKTALSGSPQPNESDVDFVKRVVKSLNDNPETSNIINNMKKFHEDLGVLETLIPEIKSIVPKITPVLPDIEDYHKDVASGPKLKFYTDITSVADSGVGEIVGIIQRIRKTDVDPAASVITSALKPQKSLSDAVESAGNLKSLTTPELISMKGSLQDCLKVAEKLGMGVQGLLATQTASNAKSTLTPLLDVATILQSSSGLAKEHQESLQKLNGLVTTFEKINGFQTTLAVYQALRKKRDTDFKNLGVVFDEAAKIPDFKEDVKTIQEAMDALNSATKNKFADAKSALDKLNTLDLEFSKFKIGEAKDSLTAMDSFFVEYTKKLKAVPPAIPPPKSPSANKGPASASNSIKTSTESTEPSFLNVISEFCKSTIGMVVLALIAVGAIVGAFFVIRHFCCNRGKKDDDDDDGPDSIVTGSTVTTPVSTAPPATEDPKNPKDPKDDKGDPGSGAPPTPGPKGSDSTESHEKPPEPKEKKPRKHKKKRRSSTSKDTSTEGEQSKETPKVEEPRKVEEPPKEPLDDKTQTNGTVSEAPDITGTTEASQQREFKPEKAKAEKATKAVYLKPKKSLSKEKSKEKLKSTPKKRKLTPMPDGLPVERFKKDDTKLKTADEGEAKETDDERLEDTQCSIRNIPCFSLARNTIRKFETGYGFRQTPHDVLIVQCDIQKAWADALQHEKDDHKFERRNLLFICRAGHRFFLHGFDDPYINCNYIDFEYRIFMAQAPLSGIEVALDMAQPRRLVKTDYKFVALIYQANIKLVIMLCDFQEKKKSTCAYYFSKLPGRTLTLGNYEITVRSMQAMNDLPPMFTKNKEQFVLYKLTIKDVTTNETKLVDLLTFSGWLNDETPREPEPGLQMIELADSYKGPVLIHCVDGVGRTGTLVSIKAGIRAAEQAGNRNLEVQPIIDQVRQRRFGAVRKPSEMTYIVLCVTKHMMIKYDIKYLREYWYIWYYHQQLCKGVYTSKRVTTEEMFLENDKKSRNALDELKKLEYEVWEQAERKKNAVENPPKEKSKSKKSKKEKSKRSGGSKDKV